MSRKDSKPFANPFGDLKGFRVSRVAKTPSEIPPPAESVPEGELFAREMERLGVERPSGPHPGEPPAVTSPASPEETKGDDRDLFLGAVGKLEVTFGDSFAESTEETKAAPRRMKQVRQGKLVPEATLDLHGLDRLRAREKVGYFLDNAAWQGWRTVLIVTGRGLGSGGVPVLRQEIERYLSNEAAALVSEWGRAPARYGGEGALIVFLRK